MKVALLLTGEVRTVDKTHHPLLENLIIPNHADIFICSDNTSYKENTGVDVGIFETYWGSHVKKAVFSSEKDKKEYQHIFEYLWNFKSGITQEAMSTSGVDREYLRNSGTLIEYFQIWKCSRLMMDYEQENRFKYDIVIRGRLDMVFTEKMEIASFYRMDEIMMDRLLNYLHETGDMSMGLTRFIQGMGNLNLINQVTFNKALHNEIINHRDFHKLYFKNRFNANVQRISAILDDISFLHSFRENVSRICRRSHVLAIFPLIFQYGDHIDIANPYSWNSENQFQMLLKNHNILHLNFHDDTQEKYFNSITNKNILYLFV